MADRYHNYSSVLTIAQKRFVANYNRYRKRGCKNKQNTYYKKSENHQDVRLAFSTTPGQRHQSLLTRMGKRWELKVVMSGQGRGEVMTRVAR